MERSSPPTSWSLMPEFGAPADVCLCTPSPCIACWTSRCAEVAVSITRLRPRLWGCLCRHVDVDPDLVFHSAATAGGMTLSSRAQRKSSIRDLLPLQAQILEKLEVLGCVQRDTRSLSSFPLPLPLSSHFLFSWRKFTSQQSSADPSVTFKARGPRQLS